MNQDKRVRWAQSQLETFTNDYELYALTERQVSALQTAIAVMDWSTRWIDGDSTFIVKFSSGLNNAIMTPIDFCEYMIDCIQSNQGVRDALVDYLGSTGNGNNTSQGRVGQGDGNILQNLNCDLDSIYGYCVAIVDYLDAVNRDILEIVENSPNLIATIARIADYIPILGDLPVVDDLSDLVQWVSGEGLSTYNAGYTVVMRDNLICGLFNLACSDCDVSATDVVTYFASLGGVTVNPDAIWRVIARAFFNLIGNDPFVYGMFSLSSSVISVGGTIAGITGFRGLATIASGGTPSDAHQTLCDPCPPPQQPYCVLLNFEGSNANGFTIIEDRGSFESQGVEGTAGIGSSAIRVDIERAFASPFTGVTEIEITYDCQSRSSSDSTLRVIVDSNLVGNTDIPAEGANVDVTYNLSDITATTIEIYFDTGLSAATNGQVTITSIKITGTGTSPLPTNC